MKKILLLAGFVFGLLIMPMSADIVLADHCGSFDPADRTICEQGHAVAAENEAFDAGDKPCEAAVLNAENCSIIEYLVTGINVLSAVAGMAIVGSIMLGGYQYMTARDNSGQIQAAKTRIKWALGALIIFIFSYSFLNFIVPGGVL